MYCINPRLTVSCSQPVSHLSADHVVLNPLHSHNHELTNELSPSSRRASLPIYRLQIDHLQVLLQSRSITASKCISKLARLRPPSVSPSSLDYGLQVCTITASMCISKLARSQSPSVSLNSHDYGLQVNLQTRSITASKYIIKDRRQDYGDTVVPKVERVTGSIYSADRGVDRHHLISISTNQTMKIHTLSFPTFGLTRSVRDSVDPRNCVGSSMPGSIISSDPIPMLLEPELLFLMNSDWMSQEVRLSVDGGLSAF